MPAHRIACRLNRSTIRPLQEGGKHIQTTLQAPTFSPLIRPFYPALDGLRAIAFLMVFLTHYGTMVFSLRALNWGWAGVDLFFVLSGFLITGILYDSLHRNDYFRNFYIRRALRIFPLFYALWIAVLLLKPFMHFVLNRYNLAMAAYIGNFFIPGLAAAGLPSADLAYLGQHGQLHYINLTPLWSLCVEEQFYLVWPAVIYLVRSRTTLLRICFTVIVLSPLARVLYLYKYPALAAVAGITVNSLLRADTLLFGAALALWLRGPSPSVAILRRGAWMAIIAAPLVLAACFVAIPHTRSDSSVDPVVGTIGFSLIALTGSGILLLAIDPSTVVHRWLQLRPLIFLGRISYGMYVFHGLPASYLFEKKIRFAHYHISFALPIVAFVYTLIVALLSFRFLESPFLRLKSILAPHRGAANDPPPGSPFHTPTQIAVE